MPAPGQTFQELAVSIRDAIRERLGVPVTVGIARTRTLAKLISDAAKPFGALAVLDRAAEEALLADRPVTEITGIAGRRAARLSPWGIRTCLDLARADRRLVRSLLTATGEALWWELNGEAVQPIHARRPAHKVLSRGGSFGESTAEPGRPLRLAGPQPRAADRGAGIPRRGRRPADRLGRLQGRPVRRRPDDAAGPQRPVRRPARRRPPLPAQGLDPPRPGDPHAPDRRGAHRPAAIAPLGLFDPPARRAAPRPSPGSSARSTPATAGSSSAAPPRSRWPRIYRDTANEYDICDVRGKICF